MEQLISPKKLVDQAYAVILDAICDGTLKPGERLTQQAVAERLSVSRQPIHNALQVLKAQGFVEETGRRGLSVVPLDPKRFQAIYQFRSAVEPLAVKLATPRLTPEAIERGRAIIKKGKARAKKGSARDRVQADMEFHSFIYELSDNALVLETMHLNWQHLRRAMGEVLRSGDLSTRVWPEHEAILEAMIAGEAERAAALMQQHMVRAYDDVVGALPV